MLIALASKLWVVAPEVPRFPYGNCLFIDDHRPAVIDLGAGGSAFADIPCQRIELALISHGHFDHINGDSFFPNADLLAGWQEKLIYSDESEYIKFQGFNLWETIMDDKDDRPNHRAIYLPSDIPAQLGFRKMPLAGTFSDLEKIDLGQRQVTAVYLPGHTEGHYGFLLEKENIFFSADIDLVSAGPWYSSGSADLGKLISSVERIKEINPRIIVSSHRRVQTERIQEQLDAYIQVVLDRENKIFDLLTEPRTLTQLAEFRLVFPRQENILEVFWERVCVLKHLQYLMQKGAAIEIDAGLYARA